jgi:hypothetical protein
MALWVMAPTAPLCFTRGANPVALYVEAPPGRAEGAHALPEPPLPADRSHAAVRPPD